MLKDNRFSFRWMSLKSDISWGWFWYCWVSTRTPKVSSQSTDQSHCLPLTPHTKHHPHPSLTTPPPTHPHTHSRVVECCQRALQSAEASATHSFTMKKESRIIRWICWIVTLTALFLLGFIIGETCKISRNLHWTQKCVKDPRVAVEHWQQRNERL